MATRATGPLSDQVQSQGGASVATFCALFDAWKAGFPETEYTDFVFGKDGAYATPTVDGKKFVLRHVHLAPATDLGALKTWKKHYDIGKKNGRGSKRTSNRVLVYATRQVPTGGQEHLLMYILTEPDAHEVAEMRTAENRRFMEQFSECAAAFLHDGTVIW